MGLELPRIGLPSVRLPPLPSVEIDRARFALEVAQTQAKQLIASRHPVELRAPARMVPPPPNARSLKVCSYNIYLGGKDLAGVQQSLTALKPDVVCVQEASRAAVAKLGDALGMYSAFIENGNSSKAILSRYPFVAGSVKNEGFRDSVKDRFEAALASGETEPAIARSALMVSIDVGGRPVDVLDTHLSLHNPKGNAEQLLELNAMMKAREAKGRTVVLAGDFNTNLALASAPAGGDAFETARADPIAAWNRRFNADGKSPVGNIGHPAVRDAAARLLAGRKSHWDHAESRQMLFPDGPTTERQRREAADGVSHPGARKRFDNIVVSRDVRVSQTVIDARTTASDHRPVMTTLAW